MGGGWNPSLTTGETPGSLSSIGEKGVEASAPSRTLHGHGEKRELADIQTTGLDSMALEALRDLGQDVEFLVGTRRSAKAVRGLFIGSLQGVEAAGPLLGLQLGGLANVAASSEDLLSTVDEVAVKYESSLYVDPIARLGLAVIQLALAVDSHNRRAPAPVPPTQAPQAMPAQPATSQRVDNLAVAEFSDL